MPQVDRSALLQLALLMTVLPLQYLITQYASYNQSQTQKAIKDLLSDAEKFGSDLFSLSGWQNWCIKIFSKFHLSKKANRWETSITANDNYGESPAVEVMKYGSPTGHFTNSPVERSPRPKHVQYRVGQVVSHVTLGYRGIIVGWDLTAQASDDWLIKNYQKNKELWKNQPNYAILVDVRDRSPPQIVYVPQENITLKEKSRISNPAVGDYFDGYDGRQYIMRPALRRLYPFD